jgi:hypothetical protein
MNRFFAVILAFSLTGCATYQHDPWTKQDTVLQSLVTAAYFTDAIQTAEIQYHPELEEGGLVTTGALGRNPNTSDTWQYFATVAFTSYVISYYLPARWRPHWQGGQLAVEGKAIFSNCAHGLGRICKEDHDHE